ncbi:hypothetical protein [Candidatus Nanohalobium constans]|uniref:Uncharacterized protein n=1 Tax=Candidatus Nanohalobium constans TaxID=2565781 RepID=A0A5Q0UFS2_9ARCH|nr:hypothetical protein [Candidatus Nanohalobium constans]QGA80448.1 hypothetical protein LC1Nh_0550 [Candidatus Nanohalobium constans]
MEYLTSDRTDEEQLRSSLQREIELSVGRDQYNEIISRLDIEDNGDRANLEIVSEEYLESIPENHTDQQPGRIEAPAD